jgi:asparagine synthase (glutamine-hydrolysing)
LVEAWQAAPGNWSTLQKMQAVDMATWLPDDLLVKADRLLMAWGLEGRVPFLDHRVVQFGLSLPDHLKADRSNGKLFLKRWAERFLPREQLWAKKSGFTVPVREWLNGDLLDRLETALPSNAGIRHWLNPEGVRQLIRSQRKTGRQAAALWAILQFAIWHRLLMEGDGAPPDPSAKLEDYLA